MTKQDIIEYVLKTPSNTNPAVLDTMLNELSGGGGGGSGDFSTAQVTFINAGTTSNPYEVTTFHIGNDCIYDASFLVSEPVTIEVPLYKGKAEMGFSILKNIKSSYMPTTTGGVSFNPEEEISPKFVVTGDGTITAKGLKLG